MRESAKSQTILVVDDEPMILDICSLILTEAGYRTLTAQGGEEAMEICSSFPLSIDVGLLDIIMPRINGWDLANQIVKVHPEISTIFMSGYDDYRFEKYRPFSFKWFLRKPFKPADLLMTIQQALEEIRARGPGREENVTCIRKAARE